jgi:hypothetical protein
METSEDEDEKKQNAVSPAIEAQVQIFEEAVDPLKHPNLASEQTSVQSDKDIMPTLCEIVKLAKVAKSTDLLKVLHGNGRTTSLAVVPCSAKQSGFKQQARKSRWVHRILQRV